MRVLRGRHRPPQRACRPGVHRYDGQRGRDHGRDPRAHHGRGHPGRHCLAAVDALAVVADLPVDRDQARGLRGTARREDTERGRPHREPVAPGVPVLGGDRGGQAPAQVLQGAALAEPGAAERPLVQVGDPQMPGPLDLGDGQRRTVPGEQQAGEDRVLRVVGAGRIVADEALDPAPAVADLGRPQVLRGCTQRVAHGESQERAPGPRGSVGAGGLLRVGPVRVVPYRLRRTARARFCRIACNQLHRVDPSTVPSQFSYLSGSVPRGAPTEADNRNKRATRMTGSPP